MFLLRLMFSRVGLLAASATGLAFAIWGPYFSVLIPGTTHAVTHYRDVNACNKEYAELPNVNFIAHGDKRFQALWLSRLQIACVDIPAYVKNGNQSVSPDVVDLAQQSSIRDEAMRQLLASRKQSSL